MSISGAVRAGRAYVEISLTGAAEFRKNIKKASNSLRIFGFAAQGAGRAATALGVGIAGPLAYAIKASSDMEETINKLDLVFGKNAQGAKQWGIELADAAGRSRREVLESLAQMQQMFGGAGFDVDESTELSKALVEAGIDLASVVNLEDADVLRDFKSALSDSAEAVDKLGISAKNAALKEELATMGIAMKDATNKQKKLARAQLLLKGTGFATGDAIKTANSFAGTFKRVRAMIDNLAVEIGDVLKPAVTAAMSKFAEWMRQVSTFISKSQVTILMIGQFGAAVVAAGAALLSIGMIAQVAAFVLSGVGMVFSSIISVLLAMVSPIGLVIAGIAALTVAFFKFTSAGGRAFSWIKDKFEDLKAAWEPVMQGMKDALAAGDFELAMKIFWLKLQDIWFSFIDALRMKWLKFVNEIKSSWHTVANTMSDLALHVAKETTGMDEFFDAALFTLMAQYEQKLDKLDNQEKALHRSQMERRKEIQDALKSAIDLAAKEAAIAKKKKKDRTPAMPPPPGEEEGASGDKTGKAIGTFNAAVVGLLNVQNSPELIELKKIVKNTKPKKSAGDMNLDWQY